MFIFEGLAVMATALATSMATAAPARPTGEARPIVVPAELSKRSVNPEASGIVWCPQLSRYLVVSDDIGRKADGTAHAPWLLAMTVDGRFDPEPVPIAGLERLNDPESLTAGPDGTIFLATSHAPRKSGREAGDDRSVLLHLAVSGRGLRVLGKLGLTGPNGETAALLTLAGVDPAGRLDVEAIAYRAGALYVGLKSPLNASGAAVILRLDNPVAAARAGALPPGALSRWTDVKLAVDDKGTRVSQGISDMTFLADGSLVLLSNTPKGAAGGGGGAMWWFKYPSDQGKVPALLKHFDNLHPEGVTLAADGASLVVVFDENQEKSLWLQWPLPKK
jgi:hypothetical protein